MIILLSPAKTLDFTPVKHPAPSQPRLLEHSEKLVGVLKKKKVSDLKKLMKVSDNIATLNVERFQSFSTPFTTKNAKPAILAFKGDVYTGLEADSFNNSQLKFSQKHVRILSGLYGLLKPLDLMQPYRLEMGTKLKTGKLKNLYEFWDNQITDLLNQDFKKSKSTIFLNLASQEYMKSVQKDRLEGPLVNVHFKEDRNGKLKVIAFNAKKARGAMANLIVKNNITKVDGLYGLTVNGYVYDESLSDQENLCFVK